MDSSEIRVGLLAGARVIKLKSTEGLLVQSRDRSIRCRKLEIHSDDVFPVKRLYRVFTDDFERLEDALDAALKSDESPIRGAVEVGREIEPLSVEGREIRVLDEEQEYSPDPAGYFKIYVDRDLKEIVVIHYGKGGKADVVLRGRKPSSICSAAIKLGLVSRLDHAAYLGRELERAYIALRTGKSYVQDEELSWGTLDRSR